MDHFVRPKEHYVRKIAPIADYVAQAAIYLSRQENIPLDEAKAFIVKQIKPSGKRELKIPRIKYYERNQKTGDREEKVSNLHSYLNQIAANNRIMAPTLTTYLSPKVKKSMLGTYITGNLKLRSSAKKAMFVAEQDGVKALYATLKSQQETYKIKNNSLSGAFVSAYTPAYNPTGHSTLTSGCRVFTSTANANNEKMLSGSRHYYSPDIVRNNIVAIISNVDFKKIEAVMEKYGIVYPSVSQVMECIKRGTEAYWRSPRHMDSLYDFVGTLAPVERAAFLYVGDFYHLRVNNDAVAREFVTALSTKVTTPVATMEEADAIVKGASANMAAFVTGICAAEAKGKAVGKSREREYDYRVIAANIKRRTEVLDSYADLIEAFWVTDNMPSSVYAVPSMIRRCVLTSDTDSTIFTVQDWVKWHHGEIGFTEEATATANTMVYLAGESVRHVMATISGNMGIDQSEITRMQMKNEYYFPVFALTSRAKHYFAYMAAQEGIVFEKMKNEIKGVALRSSAVCAEIIELAHQTMFDIMDMVMAGKKISLIDMCRRVATIEREVLQDVKENSFDYFRKTSIKNKDAYKNENSNYLQYVLWEKAFAPKYGSAPEPPYQAVAVSLTVDKPSRFMDWIGSIKDDRIAEGLRAWARENGKDKMGTIYLPQICLALKGMPGEIVSVIDIRSLVAQLMESFYLILEVLGMFRRDKYHTRLISDDKSLESLPGGVLASLRASKEVEEE